MDRSQLIGIMTDALNSYDFVYRRGVYRFDVTINRTYSISDMCTSITCVANLVLDTNAGDDTHRYFCTIGTDLAQYTSEGIANSIADKFIAITSPTIDFDKIDASAVKTKITKICNDIDVYLLLTLNADNNRPVQNGFSVERFAKVMRKDLPDGVYKIDVTHTLDSIKSETKKYPCVIVKCNGWINIAYTMNDVANYSDLVIPMQFEETYRSSVNTIAQLLIDMGVSTVYRCTQVK